ncbi:MAG: hypothetical protein HQ581_29340 [Planctomycetes bacterium]|nr:hypothetical protein [Planctomycetota bacterium]
MLNERIEKLIQQYADQYVVVDANRPELARFKGLIGQVYMVNWTGRALVEFEGRADRGRYDIELDYLKVVDKPQPKAAPAPGKPAVAKAVKKPAPPEEKAAADSPPAEKELSPLERARMEEPSSKTVGKPEPGAKSPPPEDDNSAAT